MVIVLIFKRLYIYQGVPRARTGTIHGLETQQCSYVQSAFAGWSLVRVLWLDVYGHSMSVTNFFKYKLIVRQAEI